MKTVTLLIEESDFLDYSFKSDTILFVELKKILTKKILKQSLEKSHQLASKTDLGEMTLSEINAEIKTVRGNDKNSR
jgi:hypothetical protein